MSRTPDIYPPDVDDNGYDREEGILSGRNPGNSDIVDPSPSSGPRIIKNLMEIIGPIKEGCGMTLTLTRNPPIDRIPVDGDPFIFPVALIEFGQGGLRAYKVEVDFVNGAQVFIPCSTMRLDAVNEPPIGFTVEIPQAPVGLGGFIDYYPPARRSKIYRTIRTAIIVAAGTTDTILIPPFASNVEILRSDFAGAFTLEVIDSTNTVIYREAVAGGVRHVPLPLVGDAVAVRIINGASPERFRFAFEIGL